MYSRRDVTRALTMLGTFRPRVIAGGGGTDQKLQWGKWPLPRLGNRDEIRTRGSRTFKHWPGTPRSFFAFYIMMLVNWINAHLQDRC